jgi:type IV pilus assembly protein PilE
MKLNKMLYKLGQRGFTLIELMVVVGIIGILAAIAYPSYNDSILKGRRAEGRTAVLDLMTQQEKFLTQTGSYGGIAGTANSGAALKTYSGDRGAADAYYALVSSLCPAALSQDPKVCVMITATPRLPDPKGGNIVIDSTGNKTCTGTATPAVCWK